MKCSKCRKELDIKHFNDGKKCCKVCLEYKKEYRNKNRLALNEYSKKYMKKKRATGDYDDAAVWRRYINSNPSARIAHNTRNRIRKVLKGESKSKSTLELLGCSYKELKKHLENLFVDNMSWDNYGKWHIDHIIPCSSYDLKIPENQTKCFHYTNLQPLWAEDNLKKNAKVVVILES